MKLALLVALLAAPLLELAVLIRVAQAIGIPATLSIVVGTALVGLLMMRRQGFAMLDRARQDLAAGRVPLLPVVEGGLLFLAGALMILPGFVGDTIGLLLLLPSLRRVIAAWWLGRHAAGGAITASILRGRRPPASPPRPDPATPSGPVIEGEYTRVDEPRPPRGHNKE